MSIHATYSCDSCGRGAEPEEVRRQNWLQLSILWATKLDWEKTDGFHYCSLDCLVKHRSSGKKQLREAT